MKRRLLRKVQGLIRTPPAPAEKLSKAASRRDAAFDVKFYRKRYAELAFETDEAFARHFHEYGSAEGRSGSPRELIERLIREEGDLPEDFDAGAYRDLNDDLSHMDEDWQLIAHYLESGRDEGRSYTVSTAIAAFDPAFYRAYHKDLGHLRTDAERLRHYKEHGLREGRFGNSNELIASLVRDKGALPDDFDPQSYGNYHRDLAIFTEDWELSAHYLTYGRAEGRTYRYRLEEFEEEYGRLSAAAAGEAGSRPARPASFAQMLSKHDLSPGIWLDVFNLPEFVLLNEAWIDEVPSTRIEGIVLFVEAGIRRLAPIAVEAIFEPEFYRNICPAGSALGAEDLYRRWLSRGCGRGEAPNEARYLDALIGSMPFPACFDERAYRAAIPSGQPHPLPGRAPALEHFIRFGFQRDPLRGVAGPDAGGLYEAIGNFHIVRGDAETARAAYELALGNRRDVSSVHHMRGESLRALGREREAVAAYQVAADRPEAGVWSHIHAAEGLAKLGRSEEALDRLARSADRFAAAAQWRAAGHRVLEQVFAHEGDGIRERYRSGQRADADAAMAALLARLTDILPRIDPPPAPLPRPDDGPVVILANRDLAQCDHYRVTQKLQQLDRGGWAVELYDQGEVQAFRAALDRARAAIFYRVAANPAVIHATIYARALGLATIYEIDDIIFDSACYPDPFDSFEGQIKPEEYEGLLFGVPLFRHAMSLCDVGLASTPALADAMRPIVRSGTCHVLRNGLDARNAPYLARARRPFSEAIVTVFYGSGTKAHNRDFTDLAAPALLDALKRHPNVRLLIAGHLHLDARFAPFSGRVRRLGFTADVDAYWETLSGADINLAVLHRGVTTDAKSEIKWVEAAMCGIPSIVSGTRTYREVLVDGEDVLMADTPEAWRDAIERLIVDPDLRRRIGARARAKVAELYALDAGVEVLRTFLPDPGTERPAAAARGAGAVAPMRGPSASGKLRLLVANVFFPPQTIGGATRVVRDNVDYLIDEVGEDVALLIVATDHGAEPTYRTRVDAYRGVPVFRIAAPVEAGMDWRPFDPAMGSAFGKIVDRFAPDIVHFHCIQRLTASVVEAVRSRGIPYLVTLHDAWWISDFQFLVDEGGQLRMPARDAAEDAHARAVSAAASIARRRKLGALLEGASNLLTVSETFARLYRDAGHPRILAVPNGVPNIRPATRRPRPTGRVRLGHVGGRSAHKGATLIEVVLRTTPFRNLSLTLVDHAYRSDQASDETWGTTPVRIRGPVAQEEVAELYADLDVLLAPSLWPESFGLVTREARMAGLWVVASDRGAIGEDVVEGVDGFRIDVSTGKGLRDVLARMDADPARFRRAPPPSPRPVRGADEQGAELVELYRSAASEPASRAAVTQAARAGRRS